MKKTRSVLGNANSAEWFVCKLFQVQGVGLLGGGGGLVLVGGGSFKTGGGGY